MTYTTRSQTAFLRIKNSASDLAVLGNRRRHHPPGKLPIIDVLKGRYGNIPSKTILRSCVNNIREDTELIRKLEEYK